jgi:hypothetical protein
MEAQRRFPPEQQRFPNETTPASGIFVSRFLPFLPAFWVENSQKAAISAVPRLPAVFLFLESAGDRLLRFE